MTQAEVLRRYVGGRTGSNRDEHAQVTVVAGGKGGVGASTIAALLAAANAQAGRRTLLVDAEGGATGAGIVVGCDATPDTTDVVCTPLTADLTLALLPTGRSVPPNDIERRVLYRRAIAHFDRYDAVVVDAGARVDTITATLAAAGTMLVVAAPDRVALAASFAVMKIAATRAPALQMAVLVNRADEHTGLIAYRAVRGGAERFLGRVPAWAGTVAEEPELRAAVEAKRLLHTETAALHTMARLVAQDPAIPRLRAT